MPEWILIMNTCEALWPFRVTRCQSHLMFLLFEKLDVPTVPYILDWPEVGHSSHKNWPIIPTWINMYWEQSPTSHCGEDHYPVELLCPAHRPQLPGRTHGPLGLPHAWSPTSSPHWLRRFFFLNIPSNSASWTRLSLQNRKGKVGLPGEQSLEEVLF